jgi:hypothetical protein
MNAPADRLATDEPRQNRKYKLNFLIDYEKYNRFKSLCDKKGISMTEAINAEIERILSWSDK